MKTGELLIDAGRRIEAGHDAHGRVAHAGGIELSRIPDYQLPPRCQVIFTRHRAGVGNTSITRRGTGRYIRFGPWFGYLFTALRGQGLLSDDLVLQLPASRCSLHLPP